MSNTTISFVDKALQVLLEAGKSYPHSDLDLSVAYVSAIGVSWLKPLLRTANRVRAVVGLCTINRVSAFLELQDLGVDVYVYAAEPRKVFHPKLYYGVTGTQAWAMVGSSNLTQKGLSFNVERNVFIEGHRLTEPFTSIETQLEMFRSHAYFFDTDIQKKLTEIEGKIKNGISEEEYLEKLIQVGIRPKTRISSAVPAEVQQIALETIFEFARTAKLEYAYQMLLLLVMLHRTDNNGMLSLEEAAHCFSQFYKMRIDAGLPAERKRGSKSAVVDEAKVSSSRMGQMIKLDPFPRFERKGLLDISEDNRYFIVNTALLAALTPAYRDELRSIAIDRLADHFKEDKAMMEAMVILAIG